VDIRGSASGTQEIDTLSPYHVVEQVHGILLAAAARSAWKRRRACGATWRSVGWATFSAASIFPSCPRRFCSTSKSASRCSPSLAMGEAAAAAATDAAVKEGCVGAGTGATVGKLFGMKQAMKSGSGRTP